MSPIKGLILAPLATVASEVWRGSKPAIGPGHSEECPPASLIKRRPARIREAAKILAAVMRLSEPGCYTRAQCNLLAVFQKKRQQRVVPIRYRYEPLRQ